MESNPVAAAIAFAALAGGVGYVLFTVLPDAYRAARIPVALVAALMGGLNGWDKFGGNQITAAQVEQQLLESEEIGALAAAFKQADVLAFNAYVEQLRIAMSDEERSDDARTQAALILQSAAEARIGARPFEDVRTFYELRRDELLEMARVSPQSCRPAFFGELYSQTIELSEPLRQRRLELYQRSFGPTDVSPAQLFSQEEMGAAMGEIFARTANIVGADADLLDLGADETGREARSCEVLAEVVNQIALSPDAARIFVTSRQQVAQPT